MAFDNRWRKELFAKIRRTLQFLRERKIVFPEFLTMPTGAKGNLFEFGGQDHSSGMAMIVAAPSGKPTHSKILHRRWRNELHAAMKVWPGCLVAIGYHSMGKEALALYTVTKVTTTNDKTFGSVEMKKLASKIGNSTENRYWYELEGIPDIHAMMAALKEKLYYYDCTEPIFIEWFHDIRKHDKYALLKSCEKFIEEHDITRDEKGIGDSSVDEESICSDFEQFMFHIKRMADDLNENERSTFVWVQFGYYLKGNGTLVCQARHLVNDLGALHPIVPHPMLHIVEISDVNMIREYISNFNPDFQRVLFGVNSFEVLWRGVKEDPESTMVTFAKYAKCTSRQTPLSEVKEELVAEEFDGADEQEEVSSLENIPVAETINLELYKTFEMKVSKDNLDKVKMMVQKIILQKQEDSGSSLIEIPVNLVLVPVENPDLDVTPEKIEVPTKDYRTDIFDIHHSLVPTEENDGEYLFCINCYHNILMNSDPIYAEVTSDIDYLGFTVQQQ